MPLLGDYISLTLARETLIFIGDQQARHVYGFGETGKNRYSSPRLIPRVNLTVIILNHLFLRKTGIFEYF
jgi:hypothetical protein